MLFSLQFKSIFVSFVSKRLDPTMSGTDSRLPKFVVAIGETKLILLDAVVDKLT